MSPGAAAQIDCADEQRLRSPFGRQPAYARRELDERHDRRGLWPDVQRFSGAHVPGQHLGGQPDRHRRRYDRGRRKLIVDPAAYTSVDGRKLRDGQFRNTISGAATRRATRRARPVPRADHRHELQPLRDRSRTRTRHDSLGRQLDVRRSHNEGFRLPIDDQEMERNGTGNTERFHTFYVRRGGEYDWTCTTSSAPAARGWSCSPPRVRSRAWNSAHFRPCRRHGDRRPGRDERRRRQHGRSISQLLGTNLQSQMLGVNSSFYTRIPFNVTEPGGVRPAQTANEVRRRVRGLSQRPGSGAAEFRRLAGVELGRRQRRAPATKCSRTKTSTFRRFCRRWSLGPNVLAIQGLNISASDPDALVMPELIGTDVRVGERPAYFTTPTPGAANGGGLVGHRRRHASSASTAGSTTRRSNWRSPRRRRVRRSTTRPTATARRRPPARSTRRRSTSTTRPRCGRRRSWPGYLPTNVDTQTYLFLDDIVQQTHSATLSSWAFPRRGERACPTRTSPRGPDYGLDPDIVGNFDANGNPIGGDLYGGVYAAQLKDALLSIPTMSIVMDLDDLFSASAGIYHQRVAARRGVGAGRPRSSGSRPTARPSSRSTRASASRARFSAATSTISRSRSGCCSRTSTDRAS